MKQFLSVLILSMGIALASPIRIGSLPVTAESSPKLLSLTDSGIRAAFPSAAGRPDAVFLTDDKSVSISVEWRDGKLSYNEVEKLVSQFPSVLKAQVPSIKTLKSNLVGIGNVPWAQFVFTIPGKSDDLRREMLLTSLGGRILVVTVAAKNKDYMRNDELVQNFIGSIRLN